MCHHRVGRDVHRDGATCQSHLSTINTHPNWPISTTAQKGNVKQSTSFIITRQLGNIVSTEWFRGEHRALENAKCLLSFCLLVLSRHQKLQTFRLLHGGLAQNFRASGNSLRTGKICRLLRFSVKDLDLECRHMGSTKEWVSQLVCKSH